MAQMACLTMIGTDAFELIARHLQLSNLMLLKMTGDRRLFPLLGIVGHVKINASYESYLLSPTRRATLRKLVTTHTSLKDEVDFLMLTLDDCARKAPLTSMMNTFGKIVSFECSHNQWIWLSTWLETFPVGDIQMPHLKRLHIKLGSKSTSVTLDAKKMPFELTMLEISKEEGEVCMPDPKLSVVCMPATLRLLSAEDFTILSDDSEKPVDFPATLEHLECRLKHPADTKEGTGSSTTRRLTDALPCSAYLSSLALTSVNDTTASLLSDGARLDLIGTQLTSFTLVVIRDNERMTFLLNLPPTLINLSVRLNHQQRGISADRTHVWCLSSVQPLLHLKSLSIGFSYVRWIKPHNPSNVMDGGSMSDYGQKMTLAQMAPSLETLTLTQWPVVRLVPSDSTSKTGDANAYANCETMTMLNRCMTLFTSIPSSLKTCVWRAGIEKYRPEYTKSFNHSIELATLDKLVAGSGTRLHVLAE
jgi:hypothetical protein